MPRGAEVLLDGRAVGRSDLLLEDLAEGRSQITVRREGYREARRQVRLERGSTALVSFRLEPLMGTVRVRVEGPDEFLLASPDDSWESPKSLRLEPGEHRFLVRALGWKDRSVRVKVEPGREAVLAVELERMEVPRPALPSIPRTSLPAPAPAAAAPSWQPPAWTPPPAAPPRYQPPAPRFTPIPAAPPRAPEPPAPAFTPVAPPPPPPAAPDPQPILTPVSP